MNEWTYKVVSLELAKEMVKLGWNYETERYWSDHNTKFELVDRDFDLCMYIHDCLADGNPCNSQPIHKFVNIKNMDFDIYPAPDAIEIGERMKMVCKNCGKKGTWSEYRGEGKTIKELHEDYDLCDKCYWDN